MPDGATIWERLRERLTAEQRRQFVRAAKHRSWRRWYDRHGATYGLGFESVRAAMMVARSEDAPAEPTDQTTQIAVSVAQSKDGLTVTSKGQVRSLEDYVEAANVDLTRYRVTAYDVGVHHGQQKTADGEPIVVPMHKVKVRLEPRAGLDLVRTKPVAFKHSRRAERVDRPAYIKKALVVGDIQFGFAWSADRQRLVPYHDRRALDIACQLAEIHQPDVLSFVGDNQDLPGLGKYTTPPNAYGTMQPALDEHRLWLQRFRAAMGDRRIVEHLGNHDKRMRKAMADAVPDLAAICKAGENVEERRRAFTLRYLLGHDELGIESPGHGDELDDGAGDYDAISELFPGHPRSPLTRHGVAVGKGVGTNLRRDHPTRSVIQGHTHHHQIEWSTSHDPFVGTRNLFHGSIGCLCHVDRRVPGADGARGWQQSCAMVSFDERTGDAWVDVVVIQEGRALFGGHYFEGADQADEIATALGYPQMMTRQQAA